MTNVEFQNLLLTLSEEGYELLTENERLAHQLQWRYRLRQSQRGRQGWDAPRIRSFNSWAQRLWEDLWPDLWPASPFQCWSLLKQSMEELPPPEPLSLDVPLVLAVDESFCHCLRYGIDPGQGEPSNRLIEWRRSLWRLVSGELLQRGFFHPASLPQRLCSIFQKNPCALPHGMAVIGFEFSGCHERTLFDLLQKEMGARLLPFPKGHEPARALAFSDAEQEIYWLLEDLTWAASRFPLHELAVVILDSDGYGPLISKHLHDLFGPPLLGDQAAYNLFPGLSLTKQPLFHAAFLPVHFAGADQSRLAFLSLLRSPYYGYLGRWSRMLSQWDRLWRLKGIEGGLHDLMAALTDSDRAALPLKGDELISGLAPFLSRTRQKGSQWAAHLRRFWVDMEFPVLANERDHISWQRLREILDGLESDIGSMNLSVTEFFSWVQAAAERVFVQRTGYEDAGIQVLGMLDARGSAFQRLYVPGMVLGSLPQPARSLPFLSLQERRLVQGGTTESQFQFGKHLFGQLGALAPDVIISRPMLNEKREPLLPSPFWPESGEEKVSPVIPWRHDLPAMQRARWVAESMLGMGSRLCRDREPQRCAPVDLRNLDDVRAKAVETESSGDETYLHVFSTDCLDLPDQIPVSTLEMLLSCASRFFFQEVLGLTPLPEILRGLDPQRRGQKLHEVLAHFGRRVALGGGGSPPDFESMSGELRETIKKEFLQNQSVLHWRVEMRRLMGSEEEGPGLLMIWLEHEWSRFLKGWQWVGVESPFAELRVGGCSVSLKGRIDRLDYHPEEGFFCWDYKTGRIPRAGEIVERMTSPQLPLYLAALRKRLIKGVHVHAQRLSAGYVDLRSVRNLRHVISIEADSDVETFLDRWEERVATAIEALKGGDASPRWLTIPCDVQCPYGCICGLPVAAVEGHSLV